MCTRRQGTISNGSVRGIAWRLGLRYSRKSIRRATATAPAASTGDASCRIPGRPPAATRPPTGRSPSPPSPPPHSARATPPRPLAAPHAPHRPSVPAGDEPSTPQGGEAPLHGPGGSPAKPDAVAETAATTRAEIIKRAKNWVAAKVPYSMNAYWSDGYRQDCSGYVSMAWKLPGNEWTGSLRQYGVNASPRRNSSPATFCCSTIRPTPRKARTSSFSAAGRTTRTPTTSPMSRPARTPAASPPRTPTGATPTGTSPTATRASPRRNRRGDGPGVGPEAGPGIGPGADPGAGRGTGQGNAGRPGLPRRTRERRISAPARTTSTSRCSAACSSRAGPVPYYASEPGPRWTDADRRATRAFQQAQGWTGAGRRRAAGPAHLGAAGARASGKDIAGRRRTGATARLPRRRPATRGGRCSGRAPTTRTSPSSGRQLVKKGFGRFYANGPGPRWGEADRRAVEAFQRTQGWRGGAADGYPGPETWRRLFS